MSEKKAEVKKQISKKEKVSRVLWIIFTVILVLMIFFKFIVPSLAKSGNKPTIQVLLNIAVDVADNPVEYTNSLGETHKYYISVDNSYFKKNSKAKSPLIIEREEKDGSRTKFTDKNFKPVEDKDFTDERYAVLARFINSVSEKLGFEIYDFEKISANEPYNGFEALEKASKRSTVVFVIYVIFYVLFSIYAYYQVWSRHYDEKQAELKEVMQFDIEYQKGLSKEEAEVRRRPKKITKKQMREMRKRR